MKRTDWNPANPKHIDITGDQPYTRPIVYTAFGLCAAYILYVALGWQGCAGLALGIAACEVVRMAEQKARH